MAAKRENTVTMLRDAGYHKEADRIEALTPEQEAEFSGWLLDPENNRRWVEALGSDPRIFKACPECGQPARMGGTIGETWASCPAHGRVLVEQT